MLGNCLFGSAKLTKNSDLDKYEYSSYGKGFDFRSEFLFINWSFGKNAIMFVADMSSSVDIKNKEKDILILGKGPTQGIENTTLTAEAIYPINFAKPNKRFVLRLYYNRSNNVLFFNPKRVYKFKAIDSEIKNYALCLGNFSKEFTISNMKKTRLKEIVIFYLLILILLMLMIF